MHVYMLTNRINGKRYVGVTTKTTEERFEMHVARARNKPTTILHRAIMKHGLDAWGMQVLEEGFDDADEMFEAEKKWIAELAPEYNMTAGGDGGDTSQSPRFQEWVSRATHFGTTFLGRTHSEESKKAISGKKRGVKLTEEHRKKVVDVLRANPPSPEAIKRRSQKLAKIWHVTTPEGELVVVTNLNDFCRERGLNADNMKNVAYGRYKTSKGYKVTGPYPATSEADVDPSTTRPSSDTLS